MSHSHVTQPCHTAMSHRSFRDCSFALFSETDQDHVTHFAYAIYRILYIILLLLYYIIIILLLYIIILLLLYYILYYIL